jgi:hypothetical protein
MYQPDANSKRPMTKSKSKIKERQFLFNFVYM